MEGAGNQPDQRGRGQKKALLVIDRDPLLRWSLESHLRKWFNVQTAETMEEALALSAAVAFDALILSVNDRSGIGEIEASARRAKPGVPIVRLVTACEPPSSGEEPGVSRLEKPFRLDDLVKLLGVPNGQRN